MPLLLNDVLWPNKYLMSSYGIWPMPKNAGVTFRLFTYFRIIVALFSIVCLILIQINHITTHWGDIKILADTGCLAVVFGLLIFKICYMLVRRQSFYNIYKHLQEFWDISDDELERKSYEDFAIIAKTVTIVAFISGAGNFVSFIAAALVPLALNRHGSNETAYHRPLPQDMSYGFDSQRTPYFEMLFIWQTIGLFSCTTSAVGGDCTMMTIVLHVVGQFKFIGTRFHNIGKKIEEVGYSNHHSHQKFQLIYIEEISRCITHHQLMIRVANEVSELLSPMVFGQIMTSGINICLSGYAVMEGESSGVDLVKFVVFLVSMMVQLFVWCWPGELLIGESTAIANVVCLDMPWFMLSASQQRDLNFVILRSQKACQIASPFQVMTIERLTEVVKAAGSYMALLRSMKDQ